MKTEENIDQLLRNKMDGFSPEAPDVWQGVQQGIQLAQGATTTGAIAAKTGISLLGKIMVGSMLIGGLGTAAYFLTNKKDQQLPEVAAVQPSETIIESIPPIENEEVKPIQASKPILSEPEKPVEGKKEIKAEETNQEQEIVTPKTNPQENIQTVDPSNASEAKSPQEPNKQQVTVSSLNLNNVTAPKQSIEKAKEIITPKSEASSKPEKVFPEPNIPNVITPNGDGSNDRLVVDIEDEDYYVLSIINQKGASVFESTDKTVCWDGTDKITGAELPAGIYFYIFQYSYKDTDNQFRKSGIIKVIK